MKSSSQITQEIDELVLSHYYSEDFELVASFRTYVDHLSVEEKELAQQVILKRLMEDGSIVDVMLCGILPVSSAAPVLAAKLEREPYSNQITRSLITALRRYSTAEAYTAVERFIDSDQEMEALEALADIDFQRTIPLLVRLMKKEHYHGVMIHILHLQSKKSGIDQLAQELKKSSSTRSSSFKEGMEKILSSKKGMYNPFTEIEIQHILQAVG